ncbi:DUF4386 domain-containing protein [Pseudoalteromonas sp. MMG012]|uniref:DUF4386 domain-containing protein n=1 Tax=Pseudoalteromonas sp. MMG012 TaxID=2822686 RepID=UPI001B39D3DB|nr:DUF4386 domain-containing protein [Pseudoalteromonas sp. MMG012]MBQ4852846.1 DUF4386 domain-containing protein [Pseudoalteromonas sp. MMG012]
MSNLTTARFFGVLWLMSSFSYMAASSLLGEFFSSPDYLMQLFPNKLTITTAVMLEFVNSVAVVGMAIVIYPIVKKYSEHVAVSYVVFRLIEAIMLLVGAAALLSLVNLSKELIETTASNVDYLHTMASIIRKGRYVDFQLGMIPLSICGFILAVTFFQYRIVPRAFSVLGMVGYFALFLKIMFDFYAVSLGGQWLYLPGALFELSLPFWLFVKGFNLKEMPSNER